MSFIKNGDSQELVSAILEISSRRDSLPRMDKSRGPRDQSGALGLEAAITSRFASFRVGSLAFAARTATLTSRSISLPMVRLPTLLGTCPSNVKTKHANNQKG